MLSLLLSISLRLDWSCSFTLISLCLAILYLLCLCLCLFYQCRLLRLPCHKRQSQRVFLHLSITQCLLRTLYFLLWPLIIATNSAAAPSSSTSPQTSPTSSCNFSIEGEHEGIVMLIIGSLPSALFLSAFTINVFTFARVYHLTLHHDTAKFRVILALMAAVNLVTYSSLTFLYTVTFLYTPSSPSPSSPSSTFLTDTAESLYLYSLSSSTLIIAFSFAFYGVKLWLGVRSPSPAPSSSSSFSSADSFGPLVAPHPYPALRPPYHHSPPPQHLATPFLTPSSSLSSLHHPLHSQFHPYLHPAHRRCCSCSPPYHPMLKLATVSTLCFLCFLVRVILLPLLSHYAQGKFPSFPLLLLYLCLSEVLPLLLVLYLFDPVREGKVAGVVGIGQGGAGREGGSCGRGSEGWGEG